MIARLLSLELTEQAEIAYSSLRPDDRRLIDAWFDHLRNWHNDEYVRSHSRPVPSQQDVYLFPTSRDLVIAFQLAGEAVIVLSIFREDALRKFGTLAEPGKL
jgi:hypothetical protein